MTPDLWKQLAASALIGAGRQTPTFAEDAPGIDPESQLLGLAAMTSVSRRAGWLPISPQLTPISPPPEEPLPVIWAAEVHLHHLLAGYKSLLMEWLTEAVRCHVVAPPSSHSALLELALAKKESRDLILAAVGAKGRWLAGLNPRWNELLTEIDREEDWDSGGLHRRTQSLFSLRKSDPDSARKLLEQSWPEEPSLERATFLAVLETGLSELDKALLERALTDKSIAVKRTAVRLLCQIPGSSISQQAHELAFSSVSLYRSITGTKIEIQLTSEEPTPFDNLDDAVPGAGVRAAKLARIIGCVSPADWQQETGRSMGELHQMVGRHEFADVVRRGLELSAIRFKDRSAAEALFRIWVDKPQPALPEVLPLVSEKGVDEARIRLIQSKDRAAPMLLHWSQPWSAGASQAFLARFLSPDQGPLGQIEPSEAARRLNPDSIPSALESIPSEMERTLKSWLEILPMRHDMIQTIRRNANR